MRPGGEVMWGEAASFTHGEHDPSAGVPGNPKSEGARKNSASLGRFAQRLPCGAEGVAAQGASAAASAR